MRRERVRAPLTTVALIITNIFIFFLMEVTTGSTLDTNVLLPWGAASTDLVAKGQFWRLFSAMFLHSGMTHLANNMLLLFVLGSNLEPVFGTWRFLCVYLLGGLAGNVAAYYWYTGRGEHVVFIGASGAVFSVMGAVILVVLLCRGQIRELSLQQMLVMLAFSLYFGFASAGVSNVAHVGGLLAGFVLAFPLSIGRLNEMKR